MRSVLITGCSSGIGYCLAHGLRERGFRVFATARKAADVERLAAEGFESLPLDLDDSTSISAAVSEILRRTDNRLYALVNNAGYGLPGAYADTEWPDQRAMLQVMLIAVCELTHKVLPGMVERRFGRIVNVASLAGLVPGSAGHTLYAATKSFLVKFSQSLHLENLATGVHVSALCPGFTFSEFHDVNATRAQISQSTPEWLWLGADEVAATGYEAAEANRPVCVTGTPNKAIAAIAKLLPDDWGLALMASQGGRFRKV